MSDFDLSSINSVSDVFPRPKRKAVRKGKKVKRVPVKGKTSWGRRYADGREVCDLNTSAGREEYNDRKLQMWVRDSGLCCICHTFIAFECEFEHALGKGMNGAHRDDRIEGNGVAHHDCNSIKGSKRSTD